MENLEATIVSILPQYEENEEESEDDIEMKTPIEEEEERFIKIDKGRVFKRRKTQPLIAERRITKR